MDGVKIMKRGIIKMWHKLPHGILIEVLPKYILNKYLVRWVGR
jgi:hypothetical protein